MVKRSFFTVLQIFKRFRGISFSFEGNCVHGMQRQNKRGRTRSFRIGHQRGAHGEKTETNLCSFERIRWPFLLRVFLFWTKAHYGLEQTRIET